MKSKEVLNLLKITRTTLTSYVKTGKIKTVKMENGYYEYDDNSVYKFLGYNERFDIAYARVSTYKQKNDLENQIHNILNFTSSKNITINQIFKEVASGIDLERKEFLKILDLVKQNKVNRIFITYKDRLTRLSFSIIEQLFNSFGTTIIIINSPTQSGLLEDENEILEDIISLIHILSTKMYSNRRIRKLNIVNEDLKLETEKEIV
jgi:predicted site-specific integrase-resolvase